MEEPKGRVVRPHRIPETCRCGGVEEKDYHRHADRRLVRWIVGMYAVALVLLVILAEVAAGQDTMPPNTATKTYSDTATTTVRVADLDEKLAIGGRIMTVREYMAERERLAKNLAALDRLAELVERVAALEKEVAELRNGSHWCNGCQRYCGSSGDYGTDMPGNHPVKCECPPCPDITSCYGMSFYNPDAASRLQ